MANDLWLDIFASCEVKFLPHEFSVHFAELIAYQTPFSHKH